MFFRIFALMRNAIQYSINKKKNTIEYRTNNCHDLPPCPPVAHPNWWTIWHENHPESETPTPNLFTSKLVKDLARQGNWPHVKINRVRAIIDATLLFKKIMYENKEIYEFPRKLRSGKRASSAKKMKKSIPESKLVSTGMNALNQQLEKLLERMIDPGWGRFEERLRHMSKDFNQKSANLLNPIDETQIELMRSNLKVTKLIEQLIYSTRYPKEHDEACDAKSSVKNLVHVYEVLLTNMLTQDLEVNPLPGDFEQLRKSISMNKDPENSRRTIHEFVDKIHKLQLDPEIQDPYLKKCEALLQEVDKADYASSKHDGDTDEVTGPD